MYISKDKNTWENVKGLFITNIHVNGFSIWTFAHNGPIFCNDFIE